jgi:hypothetical protein
LTLNRGQGTADLSMVVGEISYSEFASITSRLGIPERTAGFRSTIQVGYPDGTGPIKYIAQANLICSGSSASGSSFSDPLSCGRGGVKYDDYSLGGPNGDSERRYSSGYDDPRDVVRPPMTIRAFEVRLHMMTRNGPVHTMKHRGGPQRLKQLDLRRLCGDRRRWSLRRRRRWKMELGDVAEYGQEGIQKERDRMRTMRSSRWTRRASRPEDDQTISRFTQQLQGKDWVDMFVKAERTKAVSAASWGKLERPGSPTPSNRSSGFKRSSPLFSSRSVHQRTKKKRKRQLFNMASVC